MEWTPSVSSPLDEVGPASEDGFDHIVVANGTDTRPFIPYFDGLWEWKGEAIHSRWYRNAENYAGKVLICGSFEPSISDVYFLPPIFFNRQ